MVGVVILRALVLAAGCAAPTPPPPAPGEIIERPPQSWVFANLYVPVPTGTVKAGVLVVGGSEGGITWATTPKCVPR